MGVSVAALRKMAEFGLTLSQAVEVAEAMEESQAIDEQAERRRAKDRERKRLRNSAERSAETSAERTLSPDKEKSPPATPPKEINPSPEDMDSAAEAFNEVAEAVGWSPIRKLSRERRRSLELRIGDAGGLDGWGEVLARARGSPFLCGVNRDGWRLTFDWLMKPSNFNKVMEGNYDPHKPSGPPNGGGGLDAVGRALAERKARQDALRQREAGVAGEREAGPGDAAGGGGDAPRLAIVAGRSGG